MRESVIWMSLIKNAVSEILLEQFEHDLEQLSDEEFFTRMAFDESFFNQAKQKIGD